MNEVNQWATVATVFLGLVGQTGFVAVYATRPWRQYRITRALMLKSFAFWSILVLSAVRLVARGPRETNDSTMLVVFQLMLDAFIIFAIWYQFIALVLEVRASKKNDDPETHKRFGWSK